MIVLFATFITFKNFRLIVEWFLIIMNDPRNYFFYLRLDFNFPDFTFRFFFLSSTFYFPVCQLAQEIQSDMKLRNNFLTFFFQFLIHSDCVFDDFSELIHNIQNFD